MRCLRLRNYSRAELVHWVLGRAAVQSTYDKYDDRGMPFVPGPGAFSKAETEAMGCMTCTVHVTAFMQH